MYLVSCFYRSMTYLESTPSKHTYKIQRTPAQKVYLALHAFRWKGSLSTGPSAVNSEVPKLSLFHALARERAPSWRHDLPYLEKGTIKKRI